MDTTVFKTRVYKTDVDNLIDTESMASYSKEKTKTWTICPMILKAEYFMLA